MAKPRDYSLTFTGAGERDLNARGRHVRILSTPAADIFVRLDDGQEMQRGAGQGINDPDGFRRIVIRSTVAQTVRLTVSDVPQDDARSNVALSVSASVAPGSTLSATPVVSVPGVSSAAILAANANRLSATISNPSTNTDPVRVGGAGVTSTSGVRLEPGDSITVATVAAIWAYNPKATAQDVEAFEIEA